MEEDYSLADQVEYTIYAELKGGLRGRNHTRKVCLFAVILSWF